ncbi:MAG: right-handed parallel beta-helix repeat-containing protein, partial [Candidatus Micrarchaeota archaeon]
MSKILAVAFAFFMVSALSFSVNNVTECMEISSNADPLYQLVNGLAGANQSTPGGTACVYITASDIVLDCNGFPITNNGTIFSVGIIASLASNVTVQNCPSVSNYTNGVYIYNTNDSLVSNVTAHNNTNGFQLNSGSGNTVSGNTAFHNSDIGFSLDSGFQGNLVSGNLAYNNTFRGFAALLNSNNTFDANIAHNNPTDGFFLNAVNDSELTDNTAYENGNGIQILSSTGIILDNNTAYNNSNGFVVFSSSGNFLIENKAFDNGDGSFEGGFQLTFSHNNTLNQNNASGNFEGFRLGSSSSNNLSDNSVSGGTSGIILFSGSANNTLDGNTVTGTSGSAIFTGDNNIFTDNTVTSCFQGISLGANNVLTGNTVSGIAAFGGFRMESASHNNVLTDNTVFSSNRGLEILGANNTTVTNMHMYNNSFVDFLTSADSGGDRFSTLSGLVFDRPAGDFTDFTNLSITDNLENGSVYSIEYTANPGSSPTANHISFANKFVSIVNSTPGLSIDSIIWHWDDSELTSYNENNFELWKLNGSAWTLLNDTPDTGANTLSLTGLSNFSTFGIFDSASNVTDCINITSPGNYVLANDLSGASINGSPQFTGLACIRISSSNVLLDCNGFSITNNGTFVSGGILTEGPGAAAISGVTVQNCAVSDYTQGIVVINTDDSSFLNNTAVDNLFNGISARDGSTGNTYSSNTVFGNGAHGFELSDNADSNTLNSNTAHDNAEDGFNSFQADGNTYQNNTAYDNGDDGIHLHLSNGNAASGNNLYNNSYGIFVSSQSAGNTLSDNNITGNTFTGILLQSSGSLIPDGTALSGNTISGHEFGVFIFESNNTAITNDHYYGNLADFGINGSGLQVGLSGVVFDSAGGNFSDYTNLSLSDLVESAYSIDHATQPASLPFGRTSFANKFVNITNLTANVSLDSITWHWLDSELSNTSNESKFELWKRNNTWSQLNATLDTTANTLSLANLDSFSVFALLQNDSPPLSEGGDNDGGQDEDPLSVALNTSCDANIVTVTSGGSPVAGAEVRVDGDSIGTTNSSGQASFDGCGKTVTIRASRAGYDDAVEDFGLASCACAQCTADSDCAGSEMCSGGQCVSVPCSCGEVQNHACLAFQCCSDADCGADEVCEGNACKPKGEGCSSDLECADNEYCDIPPGQNEGACREVAPGACGEVKNHAFVPYGYECGSEPGCPACPSGFSCLDHECVQSDISCPASGATGSQITCTATTGGEPCALCDIQVTGPDGLKTGTRTGQDGAFGLPLTLQGTYQVSLLRDGSMVKTVQVVASPKPGEEQPP